MTAVTRDAYGLAVSTSSRPAVDAYDRGVRALLGFGADKRTSSGVGGAPRSPLVSRGLSAEATPSRRLPPPAGPAAATGSPAGTEPATRRSSWPRWISARNPSPATAIPPAVSLGWR